MPPNLNQFIECWSHVLLSVGHMRLSLSLSRGLSFYLQGPLFQQFGRNNPSSNIGTGEAETAVSPHFFLFSKGESFQHFNS